MSSIETQNAAAQKQHPDFRTLLHKVDPYENFDVSNRPADLQGWNGESAIFGRLIEEVDPHLVIEVGTWKGQSAINMAHQLQRRDGPRQIVCVDTWLGSLDFWAFKDDKPYEWLGLQNGYPSVYYQFLANVVHEGVQDVIVPFPTTSTIAARLMSMYSTAADLIYIDASHEEHDALTDIACFWQLLRPGGVMFGDDYRVQYFPGVVKAVETFARQMQLDFEVIEGQYWVMRKP